MMQRAAAEPRPIEWPTIANPEAVARARRLDCRAYERCLAVACRENWPGFSCRECEAYAPKTPEELREEAEACRAAIANRHRNEPGQEQ